MAAGRQPSKGQPVPLATQVKDGWYCFARQQNQAPSASGVRLLSAGREQCLPDYHVARTTFPCVLLEYVVDGHGKLRVDGVVRDLYPGVVFAYALDSPHDLWADPKHPMTKYFAAYELHSGLSG